jgi:hypothetical protein
MPEKPTPHTPARGAPLQGKPLQRTGPPERHTPLGRGSELARQQPLTRKTKPKRHAISPASPAQRAKIKGKECVVCSAPATTPMHLWPRGNGGCDPLCVLPACWACHRAYDTKKLNLLAHIVTHYRAEIAHAQLHTDPISLLARRSASEVLLRSLIPPPPPRDRPAGSASDPISTEGAP